ncbi:hypothetical protein SBC2_09340 [Caballeronia sp. SBC2]|nr:hypothetical protein SBC2_09340 [Caballeronia sp. SBC2]
MSCRPKGDLGRCAVFAVYSAPRLFQVAMRFMRLTEYAADCAAGKTAIFQICGRDGLMASSYFVLKKCGEGSWRIAFHGGPHGACKNSRTCVLLRNGSRAGIRSCRGLLTMKSTRLLEARRETFRRSLRPRLSPIHLLPRPQGCGICGSKAGDLWPAARRNGSVLYHVRNNYGATDSRPETSRSPLAARLLLLGFRRDLVVFENAHDFGNPQSRSLHHWNKKRDFFHRLPSFRR